MGCRRCGHRRCAVRLSEQESGDKLVQWTVGATECAGGFPHWRERNHGCNVSMKLMPDRTVRGSPERWTVVGPGVGTGGLAPAPGNRTRRTLLIAPPRPASGLLPAPSGAGAVWRTGKTLSGQRQLCQGEVFPIRANVQYGIRGIPSQFRRRTSFSGTIGRSRSIVHPLGKRS